MSYKIGFCPQCDTQIIVQDSKGNWNSLKSNFRKAEIAYEDGHVMRVSVCASCLDAPDFQKLIDAITAEDSVACGSAKKEEIKQRGLPISIKKV